MKIAGSCGQRVRCARALATLLITPLAVAAAGKASLDSDRTMQLDPPPPALASVACQGRASVDQQVHTVDASFRTGFCDQRREAAVAMRFFLGAQLHRFGLEAEVNGNRAILEGGVREEAQRNLAESLAPSVEDIQFVGSCIDPVAAPPSRVIAHPERSIAQRVEDATITAKVKTALLTARQLDAAGISVDTSNQQVVLSGTVASRADRELAGQLARSVGGVTRVDNRLEVADQGVWDPPSGAIRFAPMRRRAPNTGTLLARAIRAPMRSLHSAVGGCTHRRHQ